MIRGCAGPVGRQLAIRVGARGFLPTSQSLKVLVGAFERVRAGGSYVIAEGKPNKLIADALQMSESTVKAHVKQIIRRLHVANRTQAALLATRTGAGH